MAEGGSGDMDDVGDCPGARYNDWSDDDDDNSENKGIVWYPPWARIGTEAGTRARARARARATRARRAVQKRASPNSDDTILSPQELQKVLCLVEMSEKPYILEAALIALGNNAAYAFNRDIIRDLGGLPIVAKILNTRDPIVKEKALIVLNNLSVNAENQRRLKIYMNQVCDDTITSRLNSSVQLAGLRLLTNMTVTNEYQHMLANSISDFFRLFSAGNEETKFQVLKLLLNLAENPAMTRELLRAQVPSSLGSLFNKKENKEVILKLLVIFENINDNFKWEENEPTQNQFSESDSDSVSVHPDSPSSESGTSARKACPPLAEAAAAAAAPSPGRKPSPNSSTSTLFFLPLPLPPVRDLVPPLAPPLGTAPVADPALEDPEVPGASAAPVGAAAPEGTAAPEGAAAPEDAVAPESAATTVGVADAVPGTGPNHYPSGYTASIPNTAHDAAGVIP
ncbi:hypothetical protein DBR06_SOUSAS44910010 [Sousa chinensis]|nr:hypothetical protein DBR06_SOUSAS44910010 [Sousa chinensis]